jgi:hypothetical protein
MLANAAGSISGAVRSGRERWPMAGATLGSRGRDGRRRREIGMVELGVGGLFV